MNTKGIYVIFSIVCVIGLSILQYYLSNKSKKWYGWILPIVFFCLSILFTISVITYLQSYEIGEVYSGNGQLMSSIITRSTSEVSLQVLLPKAIMIFAFCNIPTIVFIGIYIIVYQKQKHVRQLQKMKIQDL